MTFEDVYISAARATEAKTYAHTKMEEARKSRCILDNVVGSRVINE